MHADDHQFYAMTWIVNANLTRSVKVAPEWYTSNFLIGNLDKYSRVESCCLVASLATILMQSIMELKYLLTA